MKKTTIYTNCDYSSEYEQEIRNFLFEEYGEYNDWETPDDISDEEVYEEMHFNDEISWNDFKTEAENFFDDYFLITGSVGRWNGRFRGGKVISSLDELINCFCECDYITITDENGHFYIEASHHDGTNYYEVKRITEAGLEYMQRYEDRCNWGEYDEEFLHDKLFNNSHYTHLPRYAKTVYNSVNR